MIDLTLCDCENCPMDTNYMVPSRDVFISPYGIPYKAHTRNGWFSKSFKRAKLSDYDNPKPKVLFIGMAPAWEELSQCSFFVGASGKLLRSISSQIGLNDFYMTNTTICMIQEGMSPAEIDRATICCSARLDKEIADLDPTLIVVLGNMPLKRILGFEGIKSVEGKILESNYGPVLPLQHPAFILKNPDFYPEFAWAFKGAIKKFFYPEQVKTCPEPHTTVVDDHNMTSLLDKLANCKEVVVDLETTRGGLMPYGRNVDGIRCIALGFSETDAWVVPGESSQYFPFHKDYSKDPRLIDALDNTECIMHNGQFDCGFLWQSGHRTKIAYDTMLAAYSKDERIMGIGLKSLAKRLFDAPDWDADARQYLPKKNSSYDFIPDSKLYIYASWDVTMTWLLKEHFKPIVNERFFHELLMPCSNMFVDLRHRGAKVSPGILMNAGNIFSQELIDLEKEFYELAGYRFNPMSSKDKAEFVFDILKIPEHPRHKRSTKKAAMEEYKEVPGIKHFLEIAGLNKLKSTYVDNIAGFMDYEYNIHPFVKLFSTVTGRASAEDPSVMNVIKNKDIKAMYIPKDPNKWLMSADQKQMELRWYVIVTGDEHLKELLLTSDPHEIVNQRVNEMTGRIYSRGTTKTAVFGVIYLRQEESLARQFRCSMSDAKKLRNGILAFVPTIGGYHSSVTDEIRETGELTTYFGRKRRFPLLTKDTFKEAQRMGVNFLIQSPASDTNLFGMLHVYKHGKRLGCEPLWPIHDDVLMEIESPECCLDIKRELEECTMDLVEGKMKFTIEPKCGKNWGYMIPVCPTCGKMIDSEPPVKYWDGLEYHSECLKKMATLTT